MIQIDCIVGARPNFIKMSALLHELRQRPGIEARLIHTGQHFSPEMSQVFFEELKMPQPDLNLGLGGGSHTEQTAEIMRGLEKVMNAGRPDLVLVVGDVNSTMAATLVAAKAGIPVAHVEAGLRSFDRDMPEEINRLVTDVLSRFLFVSEPSGVTNLRNEGVPGERIFFVGNVMIDTLLRFRQRASESDILTRLGLDGRPYGVVTLHRPSNVDEPEQFTGLIAVFAQLSARLPIIFPVHPRTRRMLELIGALPESLMLVPPLSYLDFMQLMSRARLVLTDSGGIQEETTILQVPCLTVRENTERPITIDQGTNELVGAVPEKVLEAGLRSLAAPAKVGKVPELWDGKASARIVDIIQRQFS